MIMLISEGICREGRWESKVNEVSRHTPKIFKQLSFPKSSSTYFKYIVGTPMLRFNPKFQKGGGGVENFLD